MNYSCVLFKSIIIALMCAGFIGCSDSPSNHQAHNTPQNVHSSDECHLCGMVITQFPGPKGQVFEKHHSHVRKFCSTNDLFAFILQPENQHNISEVYVHDMSESVWEKPDDTKLIDARTAWYVNGHSLKGAMGPTLASFTSRAKAEEFAKRHGGKLLPFKEINLQVLHSALGS